MHASMTTATAAAAAAAQCLFTRQEHWAFHRVGEETRDKKLHLGAAEAASEASAVQLLICVNRPTQSITNSCSSSMLAM